LDLEIVKKIRGTKDQVAKKMAPPRSRSVPLVSFTTGTKKSVQGRRAATKTGI
jgi:hypothetical protein